MEWIEDEATAQRISGESVEDADDDAVDSLYARALGDYLSMPLCLDRLQRLVDQWQAATTRAGGTSDVAATSAVRAAFDAALDVGGSHLPQAHGLYSKYRAFEVRTGGIHGVGKAGGTRGWCRGVEIVCEGEDKGGGGVYDLQFVFVSESSVFYLHSNASPDPPFSPRLSLFLFLCQLPSSAYLSPTCLS